MKIIVDKAPTALHECPFYSYEDRKCLIHNDWRSTCVYDDDSRIIRPCDVFIELSEFVGNAVKSIFQKQGE